MGEKAFMYAVDGKPLTPDGKVIEADKSKKLSRPIVHRLGRLEQILTCAERLMERCGPQEQD